MKTKHIKIELTANEDGNAFCDVYIDGKHVKKIEYALDAGDGTNELHRTLFEENISTEDYLDLSRCLMKELSSAEPKDDKLSVVVETDLPYKLNRNLLTCNFLKIDDKKAILKIILNNECCRLSLATRGDGTWGLEGECGLIENLQTFANKTHVKERILINCLIDSINTFNKRKGDLKCFASEVFFGPTIKCIKDENG